ncbi:MAG: helix-turn-helix transcriptional regulator [Nitrospirales bacterium]
MQESTPSAADLRAERARLQIALYELAPLIGLHPAKLGRLFNEREHLSAQVAQRIADVLRRRKGG